MNIGSLTKNASWFSLGVSVAVVLLFGAIMVQGSTTISANISTGGTLAVTGATTLTGDVTLDGGSGALTLTTSNTATSTAIIGCIQTYATSTDTAVRLELGSSSAATTTYGTAGIGLVAWRYGTCP